MTSTSIQLGSTQQDDKKKVPYMPQINEGDDFDGNNGGYMMLVPVRKKPIAQMFLAFASMILAIAGLAHDEIMDGNLTFTQSYNIYN